MFKAKNLPKPIVDLDKILQPDISVTLHGRDHLVQPILVAEFFALSNAMAKVEALKAFEKVSFEEVLDAYHDIINPVVPSISKDDLRKCNHAQISALIGLVTEHISGGLTDEKKKNLKTMFLRPFQ